MGVPHSAAWPPLPWADNAMVKALARAFRWRKMLDEGVYGDVDDLARAKGIGADVRQPGSPAHATRA